MPSPTTALELIKGSLRLIEAIGIGETLGPDEANQALETLNDFFETLSLDNLGVWGRANQTFQTVNGQATYTIGPTGNWDTERPVRIEDGYSTLEGVDYHFQIIGQQQYNLISLKTQPQNIVERLLYVNDSPLGLVTLWPVPNAVFDVTLSIDRILTSPVGLATSLVFPPGYARLFKYAVAVEIGPEYGVEASPSVKAIASGALKTLKRANQIPRVSQFDPALVPYGPVTYQQGD